MTTEDNKSKSAWKARRSLHGPMNSLSSEAGLMAEQIKIGLRRKARFGKIGPDEDASSRNVGHLTWVCLALI